MYLTPMVDDCVTENVHKLIITKKTNEELEVNEEAIEEEEVSFWVQGKP